MFVGFRLKKGRDDAIITWLNSVETNDRSYHIREALRQNFGNEKPKVTTQSSNLNIKELNNNNNNNNNNVESNLDNWM